jgi:hypothetical protein
MTPFAAQFISKLSQYDWSDLDEAHRNLESLLDTLRANRQWLVSEFRGHSLEQRLSTAFFSREPSTHFKWLVFRDPFLRFEVWVHEYKCKELLRPGYAVVPHNHVNQFSSLILSGGFTHISYEVDRESHDQTSFYDMRVSHESSFSRDMIYTLSSNRIHSLDHIQEGTTTLVVSSRSVKPFSEEFNFKNKKIIRHYPLSARVQDAYPFLDRI